MIDCDLLAQTHVRLLDGRTAIELQLGGAPHRFHALWLRDSAHRRMAELVDDPALAVRFKLAPGGAFVVDNKRALHGGTAITGSGERHLEGCYVDKDGMLSMLAVLEQQAARP